jgi:hypothetical protein
MGRELRIGIDTATVFFYIPPQKQETTALLRRHAGKIKEQEI